jgi:hypothetical protein
MNFLFIIEDHYQYYEGFSDIFLNNHTVVYYNKYIDTYDTLIQLISNVVNSKNISSIFFWGDFISNPNFRLLYLEDECILSYIMHKDIDMLSWSVFLNFVNTFDIDIFLIGYGYHSDVNWEYVLQKNTKLHLSKSYDSNLFTFNNVDYCSQLFNYKIQDIDLKFFRNKPQLYINSVLHFPSEVVYWGNNVLINSLKDYHNDIVGISKNNFGILYVDIMGKVYTSNGTNEDLKTFVSGMDTIKEVYCNELGFLLIDTEHKLYSWTNCKNKDEYIEIDYNNVIEKDKIKSVVVTNGSFAILFESNNLITWGSRILGGGIFKKDIKSVHVNSQTIVTLDYNGILSIFGIDKIDNHYPDIPNTTKFYKIIPFERGFLCKYEKNQNLLFPYHNIVLKNEHNILIDIIKTVSNKSITFFLNRMGFVYKLDENYEFSIIGKRFINIFIFNNDLVGIQDDLTLFINNCRVEGTKVLDIISIGNSSIYLINDKQQIIYYGNEIFGPIDVKYPYKFVKNNYSLSIIYGDGNLKLVGNISYGGMFNNNCINIISGFYDIIPYYNGFFGIRDVSKMITSNNIILKNLENPILSNKFCKNICKIENTLIIPYNGHNISLFSYDLTHRFYICNNGYHFILLNDIVFLITDIGVFSKNSFGFYEKYDFFNTDVMQYKLINNIFHCIYVDTFPFDIDFEILTIPEYSEPNTSVGFFITSDNNLNKDFKYHIINNDNKNKRFYIEGNVLKLSKAIFDKCSETMNNQLIVKTEDNNGFGFIKTFDFKLKISSIVNNNISLEISNNIFYKKRYIIGELSTSVKTVYNEYSFKLSDDLKNDNNLFDIINNKIVIIKRGVIYDKSDYNICVKAIHTFTNVIIEPNIINLRYIQLDSYQPGISITHSCVNEQSLNLYVGTFMYITNNILKDNLKFILETHNDIFIIKSKNQLYLQKYAMYLLDDLYKLRVSVSENGSTAFLDIKIIRSNKLLLDVNLDHIKYLQNSNIFLVGELKVINNHNPYLLEFYDYIDGIKICNNNNNFVLQDNYVYLTNYQINHNQEIIIRCSVKNSAIFTSKKFMITYTNSDFTFDIDNKNIIEGSDDLIVSLINTFYKSETMNDDNYIYKLISHINSIDISSDNNEFEIINNNQIKINYVPYVSHKSNYTLFIGQFHNDELIFYKKIVINIMPSLFRPTDILLSSNIIYKDITYIGIISVVNNDLPNYIYTTNSDYFEIIDNQIFKKPGFIVDNNITQYKIIIKCVYKNDPKLWYIKDCILVCEKKRNISNISYTSSTKLLDITLSNYIINLDSYDLCIGYLDTKSDKNYEYTYTIGNTHDYELFDIIDKNILKIRDFKLAKGKLLLHAPILSYINATEFIEKVLPIQIMCNGNILEIKTPRNIILTNNTIEHKSENYIIGLLKTIDDENNEYIYNLQETIQDMHQYNNNSEFELINENQLKIKNIPNYFNKDRYTVIIRARRFDYPDIYIDRFVYIYVIKPFTECETLERSSLYPDTIILSNNYINKNSNYIGYFKVLANGVELKNFKYTIYEKDAQLLYLNYFEILNENQLIFHNISGLELKSNYKINIVAHLNDVFFEKDFIISSDHNYGYKIRINQMNEYIINLNRDCDIDTYIGEVDIHPNNTNWNFTTIGNFNIVDNKLYIRNDNYKLCDNLTIYAKTTNGQNLEINNIFKYNIVEYSHEIDALTREINIIIYDETAFIKFNTNNCNYYLGLVKNNEYNILQGTINLEYNKIYLSNNNLIELIPKKLGNSVVDFELYDNDNRYMHKIRIYITNSSKSEITNHEINMANIKSADTFDYLTSNPLFKSIRVTLNRGIYKNDMTYVSISNTGFKCIYNHIYNSNIKNIENIIIILECLYIEKVPCIFFDIIDDTYESIVHKLNCKLLLHIPEYMGIEHIKVNRLSLISNEYIEYSDKLNRLIPGPKNTQFIFNVKVSGLYTLGIMNIL